MRRTLIIEDNQETLESIALAFKENNVEVIPCLTLEEAQNAINNKIPFDFVILDWYFSLEGDSTLTRGILSQLKNKHFKPVFVYAGTIEDYNATRDEDIDFPRNLITGYSKVMSISELRQEIERKNASNYSLQISNTYRDSITSNLEKVFFELNELPNVDIFKILKVVFGDGSNIDWSSDLILNLLHRTLIIDSNFTEKLTNVLKTVIIANETTSSDDRKKIANKILYFNSVSDFIHNGDIVQINNIEKKVISYGIVVTPDCDLEQKNTCCVELIELVNIEDSKLSLTSGQKESIMNFKHDSFYFFPSIFIDKSFIDFVAVLKSKIILKEKFNKEGVKYPTASARHLYSNEFIFNSFTVNILPICSKTNPYKSEFFQKLNTSNSRVGIPEIKTLFK